MQRILIALSLIQLAMPNAVWVPAGAHCPVYQTQEECQASGQGTCETLRREDLLLGACNPNAPPPIEATPPSPAVTSQRDWLER